jgi:hypothetical protein
MKSLEDIFSKMSNGDISDSKAYKEYLNAGGDGSFKEFMQNAVDNGWIQKAGSVVGGFLQNKYGSQNIQDLPCQEGFVKDATGVCVPLKQGLSTGAYIGIGIGILAIVGGIIYATREK